MMEMDSLSADFLELGRALVNAELYAKAFEVYIVALTRNPTLASIHYADVRIVLEKLNLELSIRGRMEDIFSNFEKVLRIYPAKENLLNDIGQYLYKYGFYKESWAHFEKVLSINPDHVMADKNLNSVKNLLVERWHFRMLNDSLRNEAFRQAIQEVIPRGDKVIDVGTGTGLLAIYACEAGATDIVACDGSEVMTELAQEILEKNKLNNDIKVIKKMSTTMNNKDLNGLATLLVTELFDAGLFGEHILQTLQHAWYTLLSEQARVIPSSAEFFIVGAQCNSLNMKYQMTSNAKKLLNIPNMNVHIHAADETYDCEDIHLQRDFKYLTEPQSLLNVNFNDLKDIEMHLKSTEPYEVECTATDDGVLNIVIGWFNLNLSETITITTNPRSETRANAWQQAVFFDEIPRTVKKREKFKLQFLMNGGHLSLKPSSNSKIIKVSPELLRFVNDDDFMELITSTIPVASVYLCQLVDISQISIADLCPFPVFGMLLMRRGAKSLVCCAKNKEDKKFFIKVFKKNGIQLDKVTILMANNWSIEDLRDEKFHAIFVHILELGGDIDTRLKSIAIKLRLNQLHSWGLFMPSNMWIVGQLVSSRWLDINNTLYDANVRKFRMAEFMNKYRVNTNYFVDFSTLKYVSLSDPTEITMFSEGVLLRDTTINKNGLANAILCTYKIELMHDFRRISTNRSNCFMDGMLFLTRSRTPLNAGAIAKILYIRDEDGAIKLAYEVPRIRNE